MAFSCTDVGDIVESRGQTSVEWLIPNYFQHCQKADYFIESPAFYFSNESWFLRIYPNGQRSKYSVEWMGLYLVLLNPENVIIPLSYTLGIKFYNDDIYHQDIGVHFFDDGLENTSGFPFFIRRAELLQKRNEIAADGILKIFFVANNALCYSEKGTQTVSAYESSSLCLDMHNLLHSEQKSDVTIKVKSQTFRAHKLILGARSSVFAAMFEHNMKENSSGMVNIEDCDPDTFQEFLLYMYTGKTKPLSSKNASQLFMLSDKYDLGDLKEKCVLFMKDNLNLDMVCDVMAIADKHNEENLRAAAKKIIISNIKTLIPTRQWITFMGENPLLASELLITLIPSISIPNNSHS